MNKLILLALLYLVSFGSVTAQKYKKGNKRRISFVQAPLDYKLQDYKTYYIKYLNNVNEKNTVQSVIMFPGFELVDSEEKADFILAVTQTGFTVSPKKMDRTTKSGTRKDGSKYTNHYYKYSSVISTGLDVVIKDKEGKVIDSKSSSITKKYSTSENRESKVSYDNYYLNINKWKLQAVRSTAKKATKFLHDKYCFLTKNYTATFVGFKFKKHDYTVLNTKSEEINALLKIEEKTKVKADATIEKVKSFIPVLEKELENFDANDKKARVNGKVKGGLLFNIGLAHMYLLDYEKALEYLTKANEYEEGVESCQKRLVKATKRNLGIVEEKGKKKKK